MTNEKFPKAREFFSAYFHQDWDIQAGNSDECVALFLDSKPPTELLLSIANEVDVYIEERGGEEDVANDLYKVLDCEYFPGDHPGEAKKWLVRVVFLLRQEVAERGAS